MRAVGVADFALKANSTFDYFDNPSFQRANSSRASPSQKSCNVLASQVHYSGVLVSLGQGVPQDYQRGRQWFEKGAGAGNSNAMNSLGYLYAKGLEVSQNYRQARQWYQKAAAAG